MTDRRPPHNLDAEESLLGSMLLSVDGVRAALDFCAGADFYKPNHTAIFEAIETLYHTASAIDPVTVSEQLHRAGVLEDVGGRKEVVRIMASSPASANAVHYARIIADAAAARRAIAVAYQLEEAGYEADLEAVDQVLRSGPELVAPPVGKVEPGIEAAELAETEFPERVLVPGLLNRGDRAIITGGEGRGKSLLFRQIGVMLASGLHPFEFSPIPALRVLIVDLENDIADVSQSLRRLLGVARDRYSGSLWVKFRRQGMNLRTRRDARWLGALCSHHRPDVLVLAPLYKAYRGSERVSKASEEAAEDVMAELDEIRGRYDVTLLLEGHAPHGEGGDRANWRPRGSASWLGWPEFGYGLKTETDARVRLVDWRGARRRGHSWPSVLEEGELWPWEVPTPKLEVVK